jgi:hypothetical protein
MSTVLITLSLPLAQAAKSGGNTTTTDQATVAQAKETLKEIERPPLTQQTRLTN